MEPYSIRPFVSSDIYFCICALKLNNMYLVRTSGMRKSLRIVVLSELAFDKRFFHLTGSIKLAKTLTWGAGKLVHLHSDPSGGQARTLGWPRLEISRDCQTCGVRRGRKVVFSRELYLWALGVCLAGGGSGKVSSERPGRHTEVVRIGVASGAGVPPSALTPREGLGRRGRFSARRGLVWACFWRPASPSTCLPRGRPSTCPPAWACPPFSGPRLSAWGVTSSFLPSLSSFLRPWTHLARNHQRQPALPPCPRPREWQLRVFARSRRSLLARGGACFPERSQSIYIPSLLGGNRQIVVFFPPFIRQPTVIYGTVLVILSKILRGSSLISFLHMRKARLASPLLHSTNSCLIQHLYVQGVEDMTLKKNTGIVLIFMELNNWGRNNNRVKRLTCHVV